MRCFGAARGFPDRTTARRDPMSDRTALESRTLLAGKIVSDFGQSSIDCVVRRLSERGATLKAESHLGIPQRFHLLIPNEGPARPAKLVWQSGNEIGVEFETSGEVQKPADPAERKADSLMRGEMLALRSAMDEIDTGVLLFDADLRAQFVSRAFRKMWRVPDAVADSKPSFVTLLRHNCQSGALEISAD